MEKTLKEIKTSLKWLKKRYPTHISHKRNRFADVLTYIQELQKGKLYLRIEFMYMHAEAALSAGYTIIHRPVKKTPIKETYSLLDRPDKQELPGIDNADLESLAHIAAYHLEKDQIIADASPNARAKAFTDLFIKNYDSLVAYAKTKTKGK